jgi:8-oxo-dGTP pyrophosphatase MutT (NUDIX family)
MQLRDQRPDIWYPGCWGCFGGALDDREAPLEGLRRELREELELVLGEARLVSRMDFDFGPVGLGKAFRIYYLVEIDEPAAARLVLHEGQRMEAFTYSQLLSGLPIVPYDAFALHLVHSRLSYNAAS